MRSRLMALGLAAAMVVAGAAVAPNAYANNDGAGIILNMVTMETFGVRDGKIHEIEAFPFVTFQYGQGDGWTPANTR